MPYRVTKEPFDCLFAMAKQTREVARPLPRLTGAHLFRAVQVRSGGLHLMVPLTDVDSFHLLPLIRPVPGMKPWLLGLSSIRNELVTLSYLPGFMEALETELSSDSRLMVKGQYGLVVDEVDGLMSMPISTLEEGVPEDMNTAYIPYLKGQVRIKDRCIGVLDIDAITSAHAFEQVGIDEGQIK